MNRRSRLCWFLGLYLLGILGFGLITMTLRWTLRGFSQNILGSTPVNH